MPKATKVGKFRSASKASSRDVRASPLTSQSNLSSEKKKLVDVHPKNTDDTNEDAFPNEMDDAPLSRGQRKRLAKREQYLKRENMVMSSLRLRRLDDQKGKLDGLDAIREALTATTTSSSSVSVTQQKKEAPNKLMTCNTNKSKRTLANSEISHMGLVLSHPKFNEDPFAAIRLHLQNSLVDDAKKLKVTSEERNKEDNKLVAIKKEERKERIRDAKFSKTKKKRSSYKPARPGARARR